MEVKLEDVYNGLPFPETCPIYIPGYTEALSHVEGVRVLPDPSFYSELPLWLRTYFDPVEYPAYYIPVKLGNRHFGFIIKGQGKMSSRFSTYHTFFNLDALTSDRPYAVVVEGIKDAGMFLERGLPALSMLTSGMSAESARIFVEFNKIPIIVQDKDAAGDKGCQAFHRHMKKHNLPFFRIRPLVHKDMGDYYDRPDLRIHVESTFSRVLSVVHSLEKHNHSFLPASRKEPVNG